MPCGQYAHSMERLKAFFSDLDNIGRKHYQYKSGSCGEAEKVEMLDGEKTDRRLIDGGNGTVTPYGVVYSDGIRLEQVYDGRFFPYCPYGPNVIASVWALKIPQRSVCG